MMMILSYIFITIITQILIYKYIRWIDKKARKRMMEWEINYIKNSDEIIDKLVKKRSK